MKKLIKPHEALRMAFARKQELRPSYSQRAFARDLGVSSVFVSKLFTGARAIPPQRVKIICKLLGMDPVEEASFLRLMILDAFPLKEIEDVFRNQNFGPTRIENFSKISTKKFNILKHWHTIAILNLLTCKDAPANAKTLSRRLAITEREAEQSLASLAAEGLIEKKDEIWVKVTDKEFVPTSQSHREVREFHQQMIRKAFENLQKNSSGDFERRLITGFTLAANPAHIDKVKSRIFETLAELSEILAEGDCSEVYQINLQLFPLTAKG